MRVLWLSKRTCERPILHQLEPALECLSAGTKIFGNLKAALRRCNQSARAETLCQEKYLIVRSYRVRCHGPGQKALRGRSDHNDRVPRSLW